MILKFVLRQWYLTFVVVLFSSRVDQLSSVEETTIFPDKVICVIF